MEGIPIALKLFDDKDHLKKVIMTYGKNTFSMVTVHTDILNFICKSFIDEPFLYNNVIYGSTNVINTLDKQSLEYKAGLVQRKKYEDFCNLFIREFTDNTINDPLSLRNANGSDAGSFGVVKDYIKPDGRQDITKIVKYMMSDDKSVYSDIYDHTLYLYAWLIEFCTFVIISSILRYIDCNLIIDKDKREMCINSKYKNVFPKIVDVEAPGNPMPELGLEQSDDEYFIPVKDSKIVIDRKEVKEFYTSYSSFIAKLHKPFIQKLKNNKYIFGYIAEKYMDTLSNLYGWFGNDVQNLYFVKTMNITVQVIDILHKFYLLNNIGINISHRDVTATNIMYYQDPLIPDVYSVRLIDFSFLCSNINFKNGESINFGFHSKNNIPVCNKPYADIIIFLSWIVRYHPYFFNYIKYNTDYDADKYIKKIISLDNDELLKAFDEIIVSGPPHRPVYTPVINERVYPIQLEWIINTYNKERIRNGKELIKMPDTDLIFKEIFICMHTIINKYKSRYGFDEKFFLINEINHGDIKLFDITGTNNQLKDFYDLYEANKLAYLDLKQ